MSWIVDQQGVAGTVRQAFDTEAKARVVEAKARVVEAEIRRTSSVRVVLWCDGEGVDS